MKKILVLSLFVFSFKLLSAQLIFDLNKKTIKDIWKIEKENKSERFKSNDNFIIQITQNDLAEPVIYRVKEQVLPDLLINYYEGNKTGKIAEIDYSWDEANFIESKKPKIKKPKELMPYILRYKKLLNELTAKFGKSDSVGNLEDASAIEKDGLTRSDKWKTDSISINLDISLRSKPLPIGPFSALPGYFVKVVITKSGDGTENLDGPLTKEKTEHLDSLVRVFLKNLMQGDLDEARKYLSIENNQQLNVLRAAIKDDKWDLDDTGKQLLLPSIKLYTNLRYKRHDDTNKPPLELLSILLDEGDKIIMVQPLKRGARAQ